MDYLTQLCGISNKNKYTMWYSFILGLKKTTLIKRILSKNFPNYNYVKGMQ